MKHFNLYDFQYEYPVSIQISPIYQSIHKFPLSRRNFSSIFDINFREQNFGSLTFFCLITFTSKSDMHQIYYSFII